MYHTGVTGKKEGAIKNLNSYGCINIQNFNYKFKEILA